MSGRNFISNEFRDQLKATVDTVDNLRVYPRGKTRRRIRTQSRGGGGAERPYIEIISVIDAANYTGNVLTSPDDATILKSAVTIKVPSAEGNPFEVGYRAFSDLVSDIYYIDGYLLG